MDRNPLTTEQLHEIGQRRKGDEDVRTLLWEIKRLRDENEQLTKDSHRDYSIISRCYQIARSLPEDGKSGILTMLFNDLKKQLENHPVRQYQDGILPDLLNKGQGENPGDDD